MTDPTTSALQARIEELEALQEKHRVRILELNQRCHELEMTGRDLCMAVEAYVFCGLHAPDDDDGGLVRAHLLKDAILLEERFKSLLKPSGVKGSTAGAESPDRSGSNPDSATDDEWMNAPLGKPK